MSARIVDRELRLQRRTGAQFSDLEVERCAFDNCAAIDCNVTRLVAVNNRTWSCSIHNVVVEDSVFDGLSATIGSGGGKTSPIFAWGCRFKHVTVRGRIGSLILNPPYEWLAAKPWPQAELELHRNYYATVDWALDISEAVFTSVPSLGFAPPAELFRTNAIHQAIVTREAASSGAWRGLDIGVWHAVIDDLLAAPWPGSVVLASAMGSRDRDKQLHGLGLLRTAGIAT